MNLTSTLNAMAAKHSDKVALSCQGENLTFQQLWLAAQRVSCTLQQQQINNIAIIAPDHFSSVILLYGAAHAGITITFINPGLAPQEIDYIVHDSGAQKLFVSAQLTKTHTFSVPIVVMDKTSETKNVTFFEQWYTGQSSESADSQENSSEPADLIEPIEPIALVDQSAPKQCVLQLYTSGTTGRPKGVQLGDQNLFAIVKNMADADENWYLWQTSDVGISALPFFHIGGLWWATTALAAGARIEIMPRFIPETYLDIVATENVTRLALVPAMLMMIMADAKAKSTDFSGIRHCLYGGSPMPVSLLKRSKKRLNCDFIQIYGLTETGNTAICLWPEDHNNPALLKAAGRPYPGVEVKCIDATGKVLKANQHGEICLKSPANMIGYRNLPQATEETLQNGWVHTGDVGYIDDNGYLFVCDRIKDMIISAGENIYPAEIEAQFEGFSVAGSTNPVAEVVAIGIPDEQIGEQVKLLVRLNAEIDSQDRLKTEIMAFLQERLAAHKLPKTIEFATDFPRTASGKVQRARLRAPFWQGRARKI